MITKLEELVLANGLKLAINHMDNTHSLAIDLFVRAGTVYEDGNTGLTHLLEHMHFREMTDLTQSQLYYMMESAGTTLRAMTCKDYLRFYLKVTPKNAEKAIDIFYDILNTYTWSDAAFNAEKRVVLNEINEKYESEIDSLSTSFVLEGTKLSETILGDNSTLESIEKKQLEDYKNEIFNVDNMLLCISGNIGFETKKYLTEKLGELPLRSGSKHTYCVRPEMFGNRGLSIKKLSYESEYIDVDMSFDIPDSVSHEETDLLNCILGEGVGSRLQRSIREELGLTNEVCSFIERYEWVSALHVRFSVNKSMFERCLLAVADVICKMKGEILQADLDTSIPFYTDNEEFTYDSPEESNYLLGYRNFILNKPYSRTSYSTVSKESLTEAARKVFVPQNMGICICGECEKFSSRALRRMVSGVLNAD